MSLRSSKLLTGETVSSMRETLSQHRNSQELILELGPISWMVRVLWRCQTKLKTLSDALQTFKRSIDTPIPIPNHTHRHADIGPPMGTRAFKQEWISIIPGSHTPVQDTDMYDL